MNVISLFAEDVERLLYVLVQFECVIQAEKLQQKLQSLLQLITKSVPDIWCDEDQVSAPATQVT